MKFCYECGSKIDTDSRFCSHCGASADIKPQPSTSPDDIDIMDIFKRSDAEIKAYAAENTATVKDDGTIEFTVWEEYSYLYKYHYTVTPPDTLEVIEDTYASPPLCLMVKRMPLPTLPKIRAARTCRFRPIKDGRATICFTLVRKAIELFPEEVILESVYVYEIKNGIITGVPVESDS